MTREQKCIYIELLALQWEEGSIPSSPRHLAIALNISESKLAEVWPEIAPCFVKCERKENSGKLRNLRLHEEREKAKTLDKTNKKRAAHAINTRWAKHRAKKNGRYSEYTPSTRQELLGDTQSQSHSSGEPPEHDQNESLTDHEPFVPDT